MLRRMLTVLLIVVLLGGAMFTLRNLTTKEVRINPNAKIDPKQNYHLKVWIAKPTIPNNVGSYVADIEEILAEFTEAQPNITIESYFIPELEIEAKLSEALQAGDPPDVYFNPLSSQVYFGDLQVPYGLYVTKEEAAQWIPAAAMQASALGKIYGYPTAFFSRVFMANPARLTIDGTTIDELAATGWTWGQMVNIVAASTQTGKPGLVLTNFETTFLQAIAASLGKPAPYDDTGNLLWSESDIALMADIWTQLTHINGLLALNVINEDCIGLFLQGKAAIIGPLNPALTRWLWNAAGEARINPVLLPIPSATAAASADLAATSVVMFRQAKYKGHSHTRATAELTKALGESLGPLLSKYLMAIPYGEDYLPFGAPSGQAYGNINIAPTVPYAFGPTPGATTKVWSEKLTPLWLDFVAKKISATEFTTKVFQVLSSK